MPDRVLRLLKWLKPPEPTDNGELAGEDRAFAAQMQVVRERRWRWRMFWAVCVLLVAAVGDQVLQWGLLPRLGVDVGFGGYAWATDVDKKIETAIEPIADKVQAQSAAIDELSALVRDQLAQGMAKDIRLLTGKRCRERDPAERDRLFAEIDRLQKQYKALTSERYEPPRCEEL